ncbi:MAG TPA: hypothetical protein VHB25_00110 [Gemmatimonadaceae bacterium]|nr:hypothetical protein [Gemmatimonadaceae bacterium]
MTDPAPPSRWAAVERRPALAACAVALVVLAIALAAIDPLPVGVVHDDGMYVVLAKSIATGHGYRWLHLPGMPAATHFPPGYPLLLALVWAVFPAFPANVLAFKALNAVLLAGAAAAMLLLAHRRLGFSVRGAALVALLGCASIPSLVLSSLVMSETLFLTLVLLSLLLAERLVEAPAPLWRYAALGLLVGAVTLVRTHGLALAVAVVFALALRRRWRHASAFAVALLAAVAPWQVWERMHAASVPAALRGDYGSYGGWLAGGFAANGFALALHTLARTSVDVFATVTTLVGAGLPTAARLVAGVGLVALGVLGAVRVWARAGTTVAFLCVYLAIVLLWPFSPARFLWAVWPIVVALAGRGVLEIAKWRPAVSALRGARVLAAGGAALVVLGYGIYTARGYRGRWWSSIPRQMASAVKPLVQWTERNTRPDDVVASNAELLLYLYTGRSAVPATELSVGDYFHAPSVAANARVLRDILSAYHVDAVAIVANDSLAAAARTLTAARPPELVLRDSIPNGLILASALR